MSKRTNPSLEELEAGYRKLIEQAVNVFGFAGVLNFLADEANERLDTDDGESAQIILDAIETALEDIAELGDEEEDDDNDDEEEEDDADDEEDDEEE
ncbi:MAG TPA: hypothetical protein PLD20_05800 [Blastocatellia bacterium]|nr:hypothetical protein [Blastocatellia bacterium]HMV87612.1 hypothetical protein [Blastocatellia bacterium]HMX24718.1 hypothetical protein [Blastocatellia bacterium]HMY74914.1 hypothetical protein [Blastocatellia bacterium]HMZ17421.1 hypothetical protein [Blastocatellia bacterium]